MQRPDTGSPSIPAIAIIVIRRQPTLRNVTVTTIAPGHTKRRHTEMADITIPLVQTTGPASTVTGRSMTNQEYVDLSISTMATFRT